LGIIGIGFLYISIFLSFQWFLRNNLMGREYIFFLYGSVWLADSAAYYTGTYFGKNRLYPAVSPNKTFEGAFGSILGGIAGALIMTSLFDFQDMLITKAVLIGAVLGGVTVAGDLVGSMFKRDAGVKDSSRLIPGHGGLLDKLDGLLFAAPVLYFILRLS
jgi:phosphatidate cytidylyltransferase